MVVEISVRDWDSLTIGKSVLFRIQLVHESDFHEIAEMLKVPIIFRKKNELLCSDGRLLFWYKP